MKKMITLVAVSMMISGIAFAKKHKGHGEHCEKCQHGEMMEKMSKEDRVKMADAHEKLATCLKSDRPGKECHEEMMTSHQDMENMGMGCGMMGKHKKMHDNGMMKSKEEKSEK